MKQRDRLKKLATDTTVLSLKEKNSRAKYKSVRNKVSKNSENEEFRCKRQIVNENIDDSAKTW